MPSGYSDDDEGDDFAFFALVAAGAYFFWQFLRYRQAAAYGGGYFDPVQPATDTTDSIANILIPLQLSPTGAAFIKKQEGFRDRPYSDAGKMAIGYGHQIQPGEKFVPPITQAEAERLFAADAAAAAQVVSDAVLVQLTQSQFDALVDFVYNVGAPAFLKSTLLRRLNAGDYAGASQQFGVWIKSQGVDNSTLMARRQAETQLFNGTTLS